MCLHPRGGKPEPALLPIKGSHSWHLNRDTTRFAVCREKLLLLAGLQAFGRQVQAAREHQRMLLRRGEMFVEWRRLSQTSPRHWDLVMADNQRRTALLKTSTLAWRSAVEDTAYLYVPSSVCTAVVVIGSKDNQA